MDIKLDFDPKEIAEKMHEAIITGGFKELFAKAVETECKRLSESSWSQTSIVQNVVKNYIEVQIGRLLESEYKEAILAQIREKITAEKLNELADELVGKIKVGDSRY